MCHGTNWGRFFTPSPRWRERSRLDARQFERYFAIAAELGFQSISYNDLAAWRAEEASLPERPIMFDFDHANKSIRHEIWPIMERFGFKGNLFVNTSAMQKVGDERFMTWEELGELLASGWLIGSHLHNHYNLAYLRRKDATGGLIREQMERCDGLVKRHLGVVLRDFAFTGTSWTSVAEREAKKRYRSGRLWIIGTHYDTGEGRVRYAELVGVAAEDEADGGPPHAARYITRDSDPYRLPSMELEHLIYDRTHSART